MHPLRSLALASLLAALIPTTVAAQPVVYTNRTAWENAVRAAGIPVTTIDFEGIVSGPGSISFATGFTQAGVTFIGAGNPSPNAAVIGNGNPAYVFWGTGAKLVTIVGFGRGAAPAGSISLPAGVRAFAFTYTATCSNFGDHSCGSSPWALRLDGGAAISIPGNPPPPGLAFVGVLAPSPIARLELDASGSITLIDDFWFGPRPASPSQPDLSLAAATNHRPGHAGRHRRRRPGARERRRRPGAEHADPDRAPREPRVRAGGQRLAMQRLDHRRLQRRDAVGCGPDDNPDQSRYPVCRAAVGAVRRVIERRRRLRG